MINSLKNFGLFPGFRSKEAYQNAQLERSFDRINEQYRRVKAHHLGFLANPDYQDINQNLAQQVDTFDKLSLALLNREHKEFVSDIHKRVDEVELYQGDVEEHLKSLLRLIGVTSGLLADSERLAVEFPPLGKYYRAVAALINECEQFEHDYTKVYPDGNPNKPIES